jgi:hypothetical protein
MPTSARELQYGSPKKMNVAPLTIGALTNETLASLTSGAARCLQRAFDDVPEAVDASRAQAAAKGVERQLAVELDMPIPDEVERLSFLAETAGFGTIKCGASR